MGIRDKSKQGRIVEIGNKKYYFRCDYSISSAIVGTTKYGIKLDVAVYELDEKEEIVKRMTHKELKGTYVAEKIEDFIQNAINGQPTFYWDWNINPLEIKSASTLER